MKDEKRTKKELIEEIKKLREENNSLKKSIEDDAFSNVPASAPAENNISKNSGKKKAKSNKSEQRSAELRAINKALSSEIKEHKKTERILRESEQRYRTLAESAREHIFIIKNDMTIDYVNRYAAETFRTRPEKLIGKEVHSLFPGETGKRQIQTLTEVFQSGREVKRRSKSEFLGTPVWLETILIPLQDADDKVSAVMGISRDITDVHLQEERLKLQRDFALALSSASDLSTLGATVLKYVTGILEFDAAILYLYDRESGTLQLREEMGLGNKFRKAMNIITSESLLWQDMTGREIQFNLPDTKKKSGVKDQTGFLASVIVPLRTGDDYVGCIYLFNHSKSTIKQDGVSTLEIFTPYIAGLLLSELRRRNLKRSEEMIKIMVNAPSDTVALLNRKGTILMINSKGAAKFNMTPYEMIGKNVYSLLPPSIKEFRKERIDQVFNTGNIQQFEDQRGEYYFINSIYPVFDENEKHVESVAIFAVDISTRRRAEIALEASERKYRSIVDNSIAGVISFNEKGDLLYLNDAAKGILGFTQADSNSRNFYSILFYPAARDELKRVLKTKSIVDNHELTVLTNNKTLKKEILFSAKRQGLIISGILIDNTARKKAERQLKTIMAELSRSNRELEQFAYIASHDLQEPLRMVSSYTQLLKRRYSEKLDETANDFIDFAVDGSNRMKQLIDDLLSYSRVFTKGKPMEPVDLKELLHDTLHNVQELIHDNNAEIIVGNLPKIKCDPSQMMRVFQNLISNSIKYRSDADPKIIIEGRESGRWFTITVSDNGIGIDPKYSERIFQIFQRLHTRTKYQGTGIGLAICKRIIERHNGKIWLETDYSGGASISFTIDKHTGNNHEREYITD